MGGSPKGGAEADKPKGSAKSMAERRVSMVREQIEARGVAAQHVLAAMLEIPRERFVPDDLQAFAYSDRPLPIGEEQTISQPYIVGVMIEALNIAPNDKVLEIGTGSGYVAAILSKMAAEVYTVERIGALAAVAKKRLMQLGYTNAHVHHGDGTLGWREHAPYDAILVSAGAPEVPAALKEQLALGGRLVIPVGEEQHSQQLLRIERTAPGIFSSERLTYVRFVPLVGEEGWQAGDA